MREAKPIRVVLWGLRAAGLAMAHLVSRRPGLELVGAIDTSGEYAGHDLGDVLGFGQRLAVNVYSNPIDVLPTARPDITLLATESFVDEVGPQILAAIEAGSNVICLAEEMVYPWAVRPDLADSLDELAHAHGVTILGTGVNPGFVLDTLVVTLTGCCADVERIRASRVVDLAKAEPEVVARQGLGLSPSAYEEAVERGRVVGHVGLEQSIYLIADSLGWQIDRIEQDRAPIIAQSRRSTEKVSVEPGQVAGCHHTAIGYVDGRPRIILEHPLQVAPDAEVIITGDHIDIEGTPNIRLSIQPEIASVTGTAAIAVNMIGAVLRAGPGVKTMADMPIPRAVLGDLRAMLDPTGQTVAEELARGWHQPDAGGMSEHGYSL